MKRFINVGFEFTAGLTHGKKITNPALYLISSELNVRYGYPVNHRDEVSKYKWICENFKSDSCGCEVPTPIIKNKADVTRYFKEFKSFVDKSSLSIDLQTSRCGLGGCHIHMGIGFMPIAFRKRFLKNVGVFLTNHPQLNWGFNDPNDNGNANSLLTQFTGDTPNPFATFKIENSCYTGNDVLYERNAQGEYVHDANGSFIRLVDKQLEPFKDDESPYRAFMSNPIKIELKKRFALRYNEEYKTLELRIFDMPTCLKQHLLHYDVAMAIFNRCYHLTEAKIELVPIYHHWHGYMLEPLEVALLKFDICMKLLGISKTRTADMHENIKTRFKWNKKMGEEYLF